MALTDIISGVDAGISIKVTLDIGGIAAVCSDVTPDPMVVASELHDPEQE